MSFTFRRFALLAIVLASSACAEYIVTVAPRKVEEPRLTHRVARTATPLVRPGLHRFTKNFTRIVAYVPASAFTRSSVPLQLLLHGSGRDVEQLMKAHIPYADANGVVILAPYAVNGTWDAIYTNFGPDLIGIEIALGWAFENLPINASRVGISGFSDGATYALGIGRANGDLFSSIVAYSPGFLLDVVPVGNPPISISHGTNDDDLPYETTRDKIVPTLKDGGYGVDFRTFEGPHVPLEELMEESISNLGRSGGRP